MANQDFKEFFALLSDHEVKFLVIGGVAYNFYAPPRATKDIDIWIQPGVQSASRFLVALKAFGFPTEALKADQLGTTDQVLILGKAPNRIDVLTAPGGVEWDQAWANRVRSDYDGIPIAFTSLADLISMKKAAGRPQDLVDIAKLRDIERQQ